jgi:hypothetical protein
LTGGRPGEETALDSDGENPSHTLHSAPDTISTIGTTKTSSASKKRFALVIGMLAERVSFP